METHYYFITFGSSSALGKSVVGIKSTAKDKHQTEIIARLAINQIFDQRWGFFYDFNDNERGFEAQSKEWGYKVIFALNVKENEYDRLIDTEQFLIEAENKTKN